jgi:uncharacterized protein (TIRG00374 family)
LKKKFISFLKLLFFLGLGALCIWIFVKDLTASELSDISVSFKSANYWWLVLTLVLALCSHILRTLRWRMLIRPMGYKPGFFNVFMSLMIGYFANLALPRLGEITRCTVLARYEKVPFQKGLGTVVAERAFDVICFLLLFFINLFIQYDQIRYYVNEHIYMPLAGKFSILGKGYFLYGGIALVVVCILLIWLFRKRLKRYKVYQKIAAVIKGFFDGLRSLLRIRQPLLFMAYTLLMWFLYFLMTYICFFSITEMSGLGMAAGFSVLVFGTIGIMIVQGGVGIYPAIVAETLALYGAVSTRAYALGWLIWCAQTGALVLGGIVSLILLPVLNKNKNGKNGGAATEDPVA